MTGYKIYLTRSREVSQRLTSAFTPGKDNVVRVGYGSASTGHDYIPAVYQDQGYFYCAVEYAKLDYPQYDLIFA